MRPAVKPFFPCLARIFDLKWLATSIELSGGFDCVKRRLVLIVYRRTRLSVSFRFFAISYLIIILNNTKNVIVNRLTIFAHKWYTVFDL